MGADVVSYLLGVFRAIGLNLNQKLPEAAFRYAKAG
jgi:hypothetical protein